MISLVRQIGTALWLFLLGTNLALGAQVFQSKDYSLKVETIASGLSHPWGLARLPDGKLLVTERSGKLWLVTPGLGVTEVANAPKVAAGGQGGLLDVVLDPDFSKNKQIYFSIAKGTSTAKGTAIIRATYKSDPNSNPRPRLGDVKTIFIMNKLSATSHHFGSRIVFDREGYLYFTIGDRGDGSRAQTPSDHAGSVLRITRDGNIPRSNPFYNAKDHAKAIWSMGHRNPQGAALHPMSGKIWTVEHGPKGGDEINQPQAGKNYGWPIISYGRHYSGEKIGLGTHHPVMEQPIYYWDPSIAPSGMAFYHGKLFPKWQNNLFVGALKDRMLVRLALDHDKVIGEEHLLKRAYGRIRDVRSFDDGALWLLTDEDNGKILRITPAN